MTAPTTGTDTTAVDAERRRRWAVTHGALRGAARRRAREARPGPVVEVWVAAADHDPSVFADPWAFDPDRPGLRAHLAFGRGPHHCLGAGLARLETAVALRALIGRFPDIAPAGPGTWRPTTLVRGRATLPVRLGAEDRSVSGAGRRCAS